MGFNFSKRDKVEFSRLANLDSDTESTMPAETEVAVELALLRAKVRVLKGMLIFTGLFIVLSALIGLVISSSIPKSRPDIKPAPLVPSDVLIPKFPRQAVTFYDNPLYTEHSNRSDQAWNDLMPIGRGWIAVDNHTNYGLPEGKSNNYNDTSSNYVLSVFHQLHCIQMIKMGYYSARSGEIDEYGNPEHLHHCFQYLRLAVQCAGDTTLEWPMLDEDGVRRGSNGWGITHNCVNWEVLKQWTEDQRGSEATGIL